MKELEFIKTIVRQAGSIIMQYYGTKLETEMKENKTFVTKADTEANNLIIKKIKENYPEDGILSEETIDDLTRLNKKRIWIIDPLDGTHHFMRNQTEFSCAICLIEHNRPILAATYKPINDELYFAVKGKIVWLTILNASYFSAVLFLSYSLFEIIFPGAIKTLNLLVNTNFYILFVPISEILWYFCAAFYLYGFFKYLFSD